jgi:S1-C subfamily serine protease
VSTVALVVWSVSLLAPRRSALQTAEKKPPISPEARERVRQAVAAVGQILVRGYGDSPEGSLRPRGSGVIVREDGVVVTSYHVITEDKTDRPYDGIYFSLPSKAGSPAQHPKPYQLQIVLVHRIYDLALLRVLTDSAGEAVTAAGGFTAIEIGDSRAPNLLDDLIIIGFPQQGGATVTVNTGLVEGADPLGNWIKTDARLIHGNSGGAAVNSEGKLIGIPTRFWQTGNRWTKMGTDSRRL